MLQKIISSALLASAIAVTASAQAASVKIGFITTRLFRRNVSWCAYHDAGFGKLLIILGKFGNTEIGDLGDAVATDENVGGFDVPMENSRLMGVT